MSSWLADFFNFWWGLVYWNIRKSWFRSGRSRCPCQSRSDSGRAMETVCEAAAMWNRPARFQRVCPLLIQLPHGLRCSVNTEQVRPFWGRAAAYFGGAFAGLALLAVLTVFTGMRMIGYQVSLGTLAWPPAWHHLAEVRSRFFIDKARQAFAGGNPAEGLSALTYAYSLDPANYQAGVDLASLLVISRQDAQADAVYAALMHDHVEQRNLTAELWFRSMIARGSFPSIIDLSVQMLQEDAAHRGAWMQALLFGSRQANTLDPLRKLMAGPHTLPAPYYEILEGEIAIRVGQNPSTVPVLVKLRTELPEPFVGYYQIDRLVALGFAKEANGLLQRYAPSLGQADTFALQLKVITALGQTQPLIDQLNHDKLNDHAVELISAQLIRHPDPLVLNALLGAVDRSNLPRNVQTKAAFDALFCACGVAGDWQHLRQTANILKEISGGHFATLDNVESFFRGESATMHIETVLPVLQPLSVDVMYALYERPQIASSLLHL